jgi:hypothetical protein
MVEKGENENKKVKSRIIHSDVTIGVNEEPKGTKSNTGDRARALRNEVDPERKEKLKETFEKSLKTDKKPYSIRLSEFLMEDIEKYSNLMNTNKSDLISDLLTNHIKGKILERTEINFYFSLFETNNEYLLDYIDSQNSKNENYIEQYLDVIEYNEDTGKTYIEEIALNNFLDSWENGTYQAKQYNDYFHEGLLISTKKQEYWRVLWHLTDNTLLHNQQVIIIRNLNKFIKIESISKITRKEAIELALNRNNTNLIRLIENQETISLFNNDEDFYNSILEHKTLGSRYNINENQIEFLKNFDLFMSLIKKQSNQIDELEQQIKQFNEFMKIYKK